MLSRRSYVAPSVILNLIISLLSFQVRKKKKEDMFKRAVNVDAVPIVIEGKDEKEVKVKVDAAPQKAFKVRPQIVSDSI